MVVHKQCSATPSTFRASFHWPGSNSPRHVRQTNSTRAKSLELHIAQRVAAELEKIEKRESETLSALRQKITEESSSRTKPDSSSSSDSSSPSSESSRSSQPLKQRLQNLLELPSLSAADLWPIPKESEDDQQRKKQNTAKVQAEIEKLRKQLGERKRVGDLPKEVEQAREKVIGCLRVNDRKPLDCWREVEAFKREVRRMEERFVGDVL